MTGNLTRNMKKGEDFEYILTNVLGQQQADSPMRKCLCRAGIDDVAGITSLTGQRIESLNYKDEALGKAVLTGLPVSYLQRLIHFKAYIRMKLKAGVMVHEGGRMLPEKNSKTFRSRDMFMTWTNRYRNYQQ